MTDFLYTTERYCSDYYSNFSKRFKFIKTSQNYLEGDWGCIYFNKNNYNGFQVYENSHYINLVLGGPILKFHNNNHIFSKNNSNIATSLIFKRWLNGQFDPSKDLSGPFAILIVNKLNKQTLLFTDLMNFIPIFHYKVKDKIYISSIPEIISENINLLEDDIDKVSLVEFVSNGTITFPYSLYKNLKQLDPATIYKFQNNISETNNYYKFKEVNSNKNISYYSHKVKVYLKNYLEEITSSNNKKNISYLLSGGEDSRLIRSLIDKKINLKAITISRCKNAELKIAKRISKCFGDQLFIFKKNYDNYFKLAEDVINLLGSTGQYIHSHTLIFNQSKFINNRNVILGGFASDRLFKGEHKSKYRQIPFFYLPVFAKNKLPYKEISIESFSDFSKELNLRQQKHIDKISKMFGNSSAQEWMSIWPSSMAIGSTNLGFNRRLFRSYEPFFDADLVKLSSQISFKEKLNRKLFYKSFKTYFFKTFFIQHVDGWYPSLPSLLNYFLSFPIKFYFLFLRLFFKTQIRSGWCDWKQLNHSKDFKEIKKKLIDDNIIYDLELDKDDSLDLSKFTTFQIFNLFQCNLILKKILNQKNFQ